MKPCLKPTVRIFLFLVMPVMLIGCTWSDFGNQINIFFAPVVIFGSPNNSSHSIGDTTATPVILASPDPTLISVPEVPTSVLTVETPTLPPLMITPSAVTAEATCAASTPVLGTFPNTLLIDNFDDNRNGWSLSDNATITDGKLEITSADPINMWIIPTVNLQEFYLEVDLRILATSLNQGSGMIAFGNLTDRQEYYYITFNNEHIDIYQVVGGRDRFVSSTQASVDFTCYRRIGLAYIGNQVQIFLDNQIMAIAQLANKGNQISFGAVNSSERGTATVDLDNLEVRTSRS